jgi:chromate reductase
MKNAVDWLSRPYSDGTLTGKPAAFVGASPGYAGTMRSQLALRQLWHYFDAPVFSGAELYVSSAREAFDEEGRLVSEVFGKRLDMFLVTLRDWLAQMAERG